MEEYETFTNRYNSSETLTVANSFEVEKIEEWLNVKLPVDFKLFALKFGDLWTPSILELVVDKNSELPSLQQFWTLDKIKNDKENEWTSSIQEDLIPFASDSMGNILAFNAAEIRTDKFSSPVYFFDHDMDTIECICDSFIEFIEEFNNL